MSTLNIVASDKHLDVQLGWNTQNIVDLQQAWDANLDPAKSTFANANQIELESFFTGLLETITLSQEATDAITNIESNGGTLTSREKYFVSIWIDRVHAKGDWTTRDTVVYAGFSDDLCKVVNWMDGVAMDFQNITYANGNWVFNGANSHINTGFIPDGTGNFKLDDAVHLFYVDRMADDSNVYLCYDNGTTRLQITSAGLFRGFVNSSTPSSTAIPTAVARGKHMLSITRINSTQQIGTSNGVDSATVTKGSVSLPSSELKIGAYSSTYWKGEMSLYMNGSGVGLDRADFYVGYEDFRTSLHPEILYNMVAPTGQTTSYRTGDDPDIESRLFQHYRKAQKYWKGTRPVLVDFLTLQDNNAFGNTLRYTDDAGGITYTTTYVIDHYTGLGIYNHSGKNTNGIQWAAWIDQYLGESFGGAGAYKDVLGYTDWFGGNVKQARSIMHYVGGFNYSPFGNNSGDRMFWTSSSTGSRGYFVRGNYSVSEGTESLVAGWVNNFYLFRKHY